MLVDILIILLILSGGCIGATRGFTKQVVTVVGFVCSMWLRIGCPFVPPSAFASLSIV